MVSYCYWCRFFFGTIAVKSPKLVGIISQCISLTSGVVQGSCLGPLLFLIYINDLVSVFNTSVTPKLYADDLKLYACLSCSSSCADFQQNLDRLTEWANVWQLTISIKKCCIMRVGNRQALDDGPLHQFVLCNDTLKCCQWPRCLSWSIFNIWGAHW